MCRIAEKAVHSRLNHHWKMESAALYWTAAQLGNEFPLGAAIGAAIDSAEEQKKAEREAMRRDWGLGRAA